MLVTALQNKTSHFWIWGFGLGLVNTLKEFQWLHLSWSPHNCNNTFYRIFITYWIGGYQNKIVHFL